MVLAQREFLFPGSPTASNDFQRIGGHPDVDLLEAFLEPLFEIDKELAMLRSVGHVDEDSHVEVANDSALVFPVAFDAL
jgi:hypothetical protein